MTLKTDPLEPENQLRLPQLLANIQERFGFSEDQMAALSHVDLKTYDSWIQGPATSEATIPPGMENAAFVVAIFKSLAKKYPDQEEQAKWLLTEHADFGKLKPLDVASSSQENLAWLCYYLESSR